MTRTAHIWLAACVCAMMCMACNQADTETLYEEGKALREEGKPSEAMTVFLRAAHSGMGDEVLLGRVYANMANMCRLANEHETAYRVYGISAEHFKTSGNTMLYAYALNNMAWEQAVMGNKDKALSILNSALACRLEDNERLSIIKKARETRAAACLFAKEYDSVLVWTAPPVNEYLQMVRAQAYSYLQQDDSAAYYAELLLPRTTNPFYLDDIYYILTHNDASADKEDLRRRASERADVQKTIEVRHVQLAQAVELLEQDLNRYKFPWGWIVLGIGIIVATVACAGVWIIHRKRKEVRLSQVRSWSESEKMREDLWERNALLQNLIKRLQKEGMNEQDIRICVLTLLGVSYKAMADMLHCSPKSVGKLKDLTAHKLGVSGGQLQQRLVRLT